MTQPTPTFRDLMRAVSPTWLQRGRAEKLLYAIGMQMDVMADMLVAGIKLRFPGLYSFESLPYVGRERCIQRGLHETDAQYAERLTRWLVDHQRRGGAYALLAQLLAYFAPDNFEIHLVYKSGRRYKMAADGTVTRDKITVRPERRWARWSLFFFTDNWPYPVSSEDAAALTLVPKEWIAAHCEGAVVLMVSDAELWNYHNPPRTWNSHVKWNQPAGTKLTF